MNSCSLLMLLLLLNLISLNNFEIFINNVYCILDCFVYSAIKIYEVSKSSLNSKSYDIETSFNNSNFLTVNYISLVYFTF